VDCGSFRTPRIQFSSVCELGPVQGSRNMQRETGLHDLRTSIMTPNFAQLARFRDRVVATGPS
jgi:hypothetical protein